MSKRPWDDFKETRDLRKPNIHFVRGRNDQIPRIVEEIPHTLVKVKGLGFWKCMYQHLDGTIDTRNINESNIERCKKEDFFRIQHRAINAYEARLNS